MGKDPRLITEHTPITFTDLKVLGVCLYLVVQAIVVWHFEHKEK